MSLKTDASALPGPRDGAVVAANAAVAGITIDGAHLPLVEAGLAGVAAAIATSTLECRFETEPAQFVAMLDAHAGTPPGEALR